MGFLDGFSGSKKHPLPQHKAYSKITQNVIQASESEASEVMKKIGSRISGLTHSESRTRLNQYGENRPVQHKKKTKFQKFLEACKNPLNYLLGVLALISAATSDFASAAIIFFMLIVAIVLRFVIEVRADDAVEKLKAMVRTTTTVMRDGKKKEIPLAHVVPGDIIILSAGDLVPADVRILESKDLFVNQSALTGESIPSEKHAQKITNPAKSPFELQNLCFMGTNVESGTATAVVLLTGSNTYFGAIAQRLVVDQTVTEFDKGIQGFTHLMIKFMFVMVPLVFIINALIKGHIFESFLFAIAVAVGLTPEMLPMIVTVNLASGATAMSKKKVIIKKLSSIQNFGAINVLCTDKTGTLTQGKVILEKHIDIHGHDNQAVLLYAYVNSLYQTGLKNIMDLSVIDYGDKAKLGQISKGYKKIDEIPWDFRRRRMSVVMDDGNKRKIICKGAVEEILGACKQTECDGQIFNPTESDRGALRKLVKGLNDDGFRVIAIAYKETSKDQSVYAITDESDLTLLGFIAFLDPPKESARKAIIGLKEQGIEVKVLTGDNELVTNKIARDINLPIKGTLLGSDIELMDEGALAFAVEKNTIFAKLSPTHKERIVRALQSNKHVVGFMGDGINDSPALKAADIGISVDSAVDIAKESSDIILLEKSLLVLEDGILEGRRVFANIIKYARMAASSNFGNMFSVIGASILFQFLPMEPLQILTNNLLYDLSQVAIPTDNVDKEWLSKPRKWNFDEITNFIIFLGPISSIFDYATWAIMIFYFGAWTTGLHNPLFQTAWFVESLLTQALIIHVIRTKKIPFIESRASLPLLLSSVIVCIIGIWLPFSPFASVFGFVPLPSMFWPFLIATLVCYIALTQIVKGWYVRKYESETLTNGNGGNGNSVSSVTSTSGTAAPVQVIAK